MKKPDRKSPVKHASSRKTQPIRHEPDQDLVDTEAQTEMVERFKAERIKLDQDLVDARRGLELQHAAQLADLERRELIAWAELRRKQGRQLGPGMLRVLRELDGWTGGPNVPA